MVSHKILCSGVSRSGVQYPLDFCRKMKCSKGSLLYFKIELCGAYKIRTNLKKLFLNIRKVPIMKIVSLVKEIIRAWFLLP